MTLPTGTGKTTTFTELIDRMHLRRPALVIAHRDELIRQAADRVQAQLPHLRVAIEKAAECAPRSAQVVVASVQSIGGRENRRLAWLETDGPELIIVDEAHHSSAPSYVSTFERFGAYDGRAFLLGVTATPHRTDAKSLQKVFQAEVYRYGLRDALKDGWLCPIRCFRVTTDVDLSGVRTSNGDFEAGALSRAVNNVARTQSAIQHWREVAGDRKTLVFCVDVQHSYDAAEAWRQAGFVAEAIDGGMHIDERRAVLRRFHAGETQVLANCAILTEGFDEPSVAAVVMLRPTKSQSLYTQMTGRGTRLAPGKRDLILIDVVDNCTRHTLVQAPALLGLPPTIDFEGASLLDGAELLEKKGAARVIAKKPQVSLSEVKTRLEEVDVFAASLELPAEIAAATRLAWTATPDGFYLDCREKRTARLTRDMLGRVLLTLADGGERNVQIHLPSDMGEAIRLADARILAKWPDCGGMVRTDVAWRKGAFTDKQRALLQRKKVPDEIIDGLTKGDASRLISQLLARKR
jgi:rhodanese-related sulfurtransferase